MIRIIKGSTFIDDRGSLKFVNDFDFNDVKRFYQVQNHSRNYIRAWHGHLKEAKYVYVPQGSVLVGIVPITNQTYLDESVQNVENQSQPQKFILSSENPSILYIPPGYANGFKTLTDDCIVQFFSTSTIDESKNDDIRFEWNKWNIWEENYR